MKKIIFLVGVLFTFASISVFSQTVELEKGYISVNLSDTKELLPNQAEISFTVETSDKLLKVASDLNKQIANKVYLSLKTHIAAGDYLKTGQYDVRPEYIYTKDNKKILDKYTVTNTVMLKTKNIALVTKFIDLAVTNGANKVNNLVFSASDYNSSCNDYLADLTKKAYNQASYIAKSVNSQITGVKAINASCTTNNSPRPYYAIMGSKAVVDNSYSNPIESGKIIINLNINSSFYVK